MTSYDLTARRRYSREEKAAIVAEAIKENSVSAVARRHRMAAALLFRWKKELAPAAAAPAGSDAPAATPTRFVPATIGPVEATKKAASPRRSLMSRSTRSARGLFRRRRIGAGRASTRISTLRAATASPIRRPSLRASTISRSCCAPARTPPPQWRSAVRKRLAARSATGASRNTSTPPSAATRRRENVGGEREIAHCHRNSRLSSPASMEPASEQCALA